MIVRLAPQSLPRRCLPLLLYTALAAGRGAAQTAPTAPAHARYWFNAGAGWGRASEGLFGGIGLGTGLSLTYQPSPLLFTARISGVWSVVQGDLMRDAALLVGVGTRGALTPRSRWVRR